MTMRVLARLRSLQEVPITTSQAPTFGAHVDVAAEPAASTVQSSVEETLPQMPTPRVAGICWHDGHIDFGDTRLGVLVVDEHHASLLPCPYLNKEGR